jgi:hypothetical protein
MRPSLRAWRMRQGLQGHRCYLACACGFQSPSRSMLRFGLSSTTLSGPEQPQLSFVSLTSAHRCARTGIA